MKDKPTGLVTFLFTDIEGSTRLAQEFPDSLPAALEKHNAIMHKATESNSGFVYEIVGDAFCCAFEQAEDAVKAAVDAQISLANEKWDEVRIKIRIGIHSGNVEWNGNRYMGYITLARTARVMSSAYGEQIIISNDAYELSVPKLGFGNERDGKITNKISFRDLGERRLKDLKQPVRLFQILFAGLREDFPPLKTLDARPNNLPVQLTSFIGREAEMKTVKDLLKQTHLLTLTGSGGAGKTRLALQVAADVIDDFANGVWFVELAALSEPAFLPQAIMKVFDIKEEPKRSPEDTLCDFFRDKEMLIILDNCEHLIESCARLAEKLLNNSSKLKIIATSREGLRCEGEQTHRTLSLDTPDPKDEDTPEKLSQYESVRLFIERALAVDTSFRVNNNNAPALAQICFQLDGIPLAIELAAARTKVLSVEQIYQRLDDRFNLLTGGKRTALPRQQTLRALIDWSYDLLSEKEKLLWRRLSVFAGGWTLEAAEEVCSDEKINKEEVLEMLSLLTEKSIIIFNQEEERYIMLETIRQYGEESLDINAGTQKALQNHLNYYLILAEKYEPELNGPEIKKYSGAFERDKLNMEKGMLTSLKGSIVEKGIRILYSLGYYWGIIGNISAGIKWAKDFIENCSNTDELDNPKFLYSAGIFSYSQENEESRVYFEKGLSICQKNGDTKLESLFKNILGYVHYRHGQYEKALEIFNQSIVISKKAGYSNVECRSLLGITTIYVDRGNYDDAASTMEECLRISTLSNNKLVIASCLIKMGDIAFDTGNYEKCKLYYSESLKVYNEIGNKSGSATALNYLGLLFKNQREFNTSKDYLEKSLEIHENIGSNSGIALVLIGLGNLSREFGDNQKAKVYYERSLSINKIFGQNNQLACIYNNLGNISYNQKKYSKARTLLKKSLSISTKIDSKPMIVFSNLILGCISLDEEHFSDARKFFSKSLKLSKEIGHKLHLVQSLNYLGYMVFLSAEYEESLNYFKENLMLSHQFEYNIYFTENIIGIAANFNKLKKFEKAVTLCGAVDELRNKKPEDIGKNFSNLYKEVLFNLRSKLTEQNFDIQFKKGKLLNIKKVINFILN